MGGAGMHHIHDAGARVCVPFLRLFLAPPRTMRVLQGASKNVSIQGPTYIPCHGEISMHPSERAARPGQAAGGTSAATQQRRASATALNPGWAVRPGVVARLQLAAGILAHMDFAHSRYIVRHAGPLLASTAQQKLRAASARAEALAKRQKAAEHGSCWTLRQWAGGCAPARRQRNCNLFATCWQLDTAIRGALKGLLIDLKS